MEPNHLVNLDRLAGTSVMDDRGIGRDDRPHASANPPHAKIGLFAIHEEFWIKPTKGIPVFDPHQEETTCHDSYFTDAVPLPSSVTPRIENQGFGEHRSQAKRSTELRPKREGTPTARWIQRPVGEDGSSSPYSVLRIFLGELQQLFDRSIKDDRIWIEQEEVLALRRFRQDVVGSGESKVLVS